jgi:hypothetical protein
MSRVQNELYHHQEKLPETLREKGHKVTRHAAKEELEIEVPNVEKIAKTEQIKQLLDKLKEFELEGIWFPQILIDESLSPFQMKIAQQFVDLEEYIEKEMLYKYIEEAGGKKDRRALDNMFFAAYYLTLDEEVHYKRLVNYYFPKKRSFTDKEILEKWKMLSLESSLGKNFESAVQAVRFTKLHFKTTKRRASGKKHYIADANPYGFKLIKTRPFKKKSDRVFINLIKRV